MLTALRSHFDKDLEPYVCISEKCNDPPFYFANIKQWFSHMNNVHSNHWHRDIHRSKVWYCDLSHPGRQRLGKFPSSAALEKHFHENHATLNGKMISLRLQRNVLTVSRPSNVCPLCNEPVPDLLSELQDNNKRVSQHVAQHLKIVAFISLDWFDGDCFSTGNEVSTRTSQSSEKSVLENEVESASKSQGTLRARISKLTYPQVPEDDSSDSRSSRSEDASHSLAEQLYRRLEKSVFGHGSREFLPKDSLDELINPKSIVESLFSGTKSPGELLTTDDMELVQFVFTAARKLFAISVSVLLERSGSGPLLKTIQLFRLHNIDDNDLPFEDSEDSILATLESGVKNRKKIWKPSTMHEFRDHQWRFLVPEFTTDPQARRTKLNLPAPTILPFLKKFAEGSGAYGKVTKYEVHPSHIRDPLRPVGATATICHIYANTNRISNVPQLSLLKNLCRRMDIIVNSPSSSGNENVRL